MTKILEFLRGSSLSSRKFVTATGMALIVLLNRKLNLGFTPEELTQAVAMLGIWIFGESAVDVAGVFKAAKALPGPTFTYAAAATSATSNIAEAPK